MRHLITLVLLSTAPLAAQTLPGPPAEAPRCSYDDCALRTEPRIFQGTQLLRGAEGERVGTLGLFGSTLSRAVQDDAVAFRSARTYETSRAPATALIVGGAVLAVVSNAALWSGFDVFAPRDRGNETLALAGYVAGLGLMVGGGVVAIRGQQAQSRAVWEYNRGLAPPGR